MEDFNPLNEKHIQISNAGLCLLTPWLNRLFDMLDYLNEEKTFVNTEAQIHAVFLLQYFVYGDRAIFQSIAGRTPLACSASEADAF